MNIKRNIIFALEARKKNGVAITENVPLFSTDCPIKQVHNACCISACTWTTKNIQ